MDRLLVVAPHPDDDVLACGGTLALAAAAGAAICVVYLTDGSASHPHSRTHDARSRRDVREREALQGLGELRIDASAARFLRLPDGELGRHAGAATDALARECAAFRPSIVLGPWQHDPHDDHRAAAAALAVALTGHSSSARLLCYTVWLGERGSPSERARAETGTTLTVDISRVLLQKRRAIAAHRSQFGRVMRDDPSGFRLPHSLIARSTAPTERFLAVRRP